MVGPGMLMVGQAPVWLRHHTCVEVFFLKQCNISLMNQTLWSQGAYRLEIISARSERVW